MTRLLFATIKKAIEDYTAPRKRLIIADRTNFLQLTQNQDESVVDFLARINDASVHCKWDSLATEGPNDELVKLRFIAGVRNDQLKLKILEKLQIQPDMNISDIIDFCQMNFQLADFVAPTSSTKEEDKQVDNFFVAQPPAQRKPCRYYGSNHPPRSCPAFGKNCNKCGRKNHFAKCCRQRSYFKSSQQSSQMRFDESETHNVDIFTVRSTSSDPIIRTLTIHDRPVRFQIDTGAEKSIISRWQWEQLGCPTLQPTCLQPTNYDGSRSKTLGELTTELFLSDENKSVSTKLLVVEANKCYGLLGRDVLNKMSDNFSDSAYTYAISDDFLPPIKGFSASISLKDTTKPLKFVKARSVPVHLKEALDMELDVLQRQGVITPIQSANQASPVVWVRKPNGRFRMCVDFKATLNSNILSDAYPMPTAEEIFCRVGTACKFAKVDLKSAYSQVALDEEARALSIINTHRGLYTVERLQMGMKNASAIFQRCMEQILVGIPGIIVYQDDVMVCADSSRQLKKRLAQLKLRLKEFNVTVNSDKCVDECDSLRFLGFIFSAKGVSPDPALTTKIADAPSPSSSSELASFIGLATFYGRFVSNFAELCAPLHDAMTKKSNFHWSDD